MSYTPEQIQQIITQEATALGVDPQLALAIARQESGLNPNSVGDNGHSVGLFQLNDQGEGAGMSVAARQDPVANARIALTQVANVMKAEPGLSPGELAAAAQRPLDRVGYAKAINSALGSTLSPEQLADQSPEGVAYRAAHGAGATNSLSDSTNNAGVSIDGFLRSQAPELARALGSDPQVTALLNAWSSNQISDPEFQNQLEQTHWWKTTSAPQRTLLVQRATDPATFAQDQATATPTDLNTLKSLYSDYAIPATDQKLNSTLQALLGGTTTLQAQQSLIAQQAKTLYSQNPQLASFIDDTHSVRDWADPYLASAASLLGLNQHSIDLNQPMWQKVLNPAVSPTTGQSTGSAMTLDQWNQTLRTDPTYGFDTSQNGVSTASQFANQLVSKLTGSGV